MIKNVDIQLFLGKAAEKYIDEVANLRIQIFREFPYLYDGDAAYEKSYLGKFINTEDSLIVLAFVEENIIGALTGLPLKYEEINIKKPWLDLNYSINNIFYFSEGLIFEEYRGQGIGKRMFELAESWVKGTHRFNTFTLATVLRANNHPKKPTTYQSTDPFWYKLGYVKTDGIVCTIPWKEVEETDETPKPLLFWSKKIF